MTGPQVFGHDLLRGHSGAYPAETRGGGWGGGVVISPSHFQILRSILLCWMVSHKNKNQTGNKMRKTNYSQLWPKTLSPPELVRMTMSCFITSWDSSGATLSPQKSDLLEKYSKPWNWHVSISRICWSGCVLTATLTLIM